MGVFLLSQTVVGILGNFSLLYHYVFLFCMGNRMRGTDLILMHLIVANFLNLLCRGIPQTMVAWGWRYFLSDLGCKLVFYLHRVGRGMAIGSICFLSVFQAVSISPGDSRCAWLKGRAHKHIVSMVYLSWGVSLLVNITFLIYITGPKTDENMTIVKDYGYCSSMLKNPAADVLLIVLLSVADVLGLGLMLWASISMLFVLYTHKQRMQHIQRTSVSCRASPESRATKNILLLVSTFVSFYTWSCICQIYMAMTYNPSPVLHHMAAFAMGCFPAVSPFLLMSGRSTPYSLCFACRRRRKVVLP
ncbi:vomeronasal type-1 receptor 4-like [Perognathus longimembris pacificus]|uniref:vomeronasal type-1 receptor 4-like n=1 Tax=Perognathus longimembris pacificus TaxID=214514 RepID=UPI002018FAE3|nr:vomeronasal type-1 receptor 4-like [Perognathus longimembris pacificus]XP_048193016.1 vomeronasal type-1 receptor 4-like [Perognathus longimembris pacificus]